MDGHIIELFCAAQPFEEGAIHRDETYRRKVRLINAIRKKLKELYGEEAENILLDFCLVVRDMELDQCLHYFHQGYLAARGELQIKED